MDEIEAFFSGYPPTVAAIAGALRAMVRAAMPGAQEVLLARENHVSYGASVSRVDHLVYICPLPSYVRLGFYYGGTLPDPSGRLVGEGKRLRHVKVYSLAEAAEPALVALVEAAWAAAPAPRRSARSARA